jgi:hypothetical protein
MRTIPAHPFAQASAPHGDMFVARSAGQSYQEEAMKGVVFLGDRKLELREFSDPIPGPRDVILEIKASGMCGSLGPSYDQGSPRPSPNRGECFSGEQS